MTRNKKILNKIKNPSDIKDLNLSELSILSEELRIDLINIISKTGGHLGAGLGVIELTIALHYVFDTPDDKLIWDVGHQSHPHKMLTERRSKMLSIRQDGGLSGFTNRSESKFDPFGAGHSSTSISAGIGMSVARDILKKENDVVAVIGDGAMSAGLAWEALNNLGAQKNRMIVILNDNEMSISPAVGAISSYLSKLISSQPLNSIRQIAKELVSNFPSEIENAAKKADKLARGVIGSGTIFSQLGLNYIGPVDGHNISDLVNLLRNFKSNHDFSPILLHVVTEKGKGHPFGKDVPEKYHAVPKFDVITGEQKKSASKVPTFTQVFSNTLIKEAKKEKKIVAVTAAMSSGTGLDKFAEEFSDRFFDVGIAEQHAVTFCAGMAAEGLKPFCVIYSTFLQRAYDQIIHDVAIQNLPVRFAIDRAGFVGADGSTHQGSYDIAYLSSLPNFVVMAPSDEDELSKMISFAVKYDKGPIAFRYPRGETYGYNLDNKSVDIEIGKGRLIYDAFKNNKKGDIALISIGTRLKDCIEASKDLNKVGINCTIVDGRFAKPFDRDLILDVSKKNKAILIVEEGSIGGFASHILNFLANNNLISDNLRVSSLILPDRFIDHKNQHQQILEANLDKKSIYNKACEILDKNQYLSAV